MSTSSEEPMNREDPDRFIEFRIIDSIPQGIFWKDCDSNYLGCNAAFAKAVGLTSPDLIRGKTDYDLPWPREEADAYIADDREVMERGRSKRAILEPLQQADGTRIRTETTKVPLRDEKDRIIGVLGLYADVTEHHRQAIDLRETKLMLQSVLDHIPARVFWKDLDCVYLGCNRLFAQDSGLENPEQIIGKTDFEMGWADQAELYRADDQAVMASGEPKVGYEEPQTTPDGGKIWLRTSKKPLHDLDDRIIGVLGTYEDITASKQAEAEQRSLEAQVQHAQKLESLGILAGGIAHDFNNLLAAILGHADLALHSLSPETEGHQNLTEIRTAALRARELTNQMLAYSGKGRFVVKSLQLGDVVSEMVSLLETVIPKKVHLRCNLAEDLPVVNVDVAQIRQVVMNLVTNAAEAAGGRSGTISLTTGLQHATGEYLKSSDLHVDLPPGDYVYLEVSDDGCGMDKATLERLFEPFFTTKFHGRGLGLAAVQGIVRGHGGTIRVYSESGKGSSFKVLLPSSGAAIADTVEKDPATGSAAPLQGTILVVDDEAAILKVARQMLMRIGLKVMTAGDGIDALTLYTQHHGEIDLVLLDMTMPRMDGEETFRELRARDPEVRVVLASGYNQQDATSHFVGKGLAGFIQKPYTLRDLEAVLRKALDTA